MSTKSKRRTRRTCKSSNSDSPLPTPSSAQRKFKNSVAFEFECEPLQDTSLSSVFTDKEESIIKSKKSTKNRLVKKTKILENQPEEPDSTTNTISDLEIGASIQDLSKIMDADSEDTSGRSLLNAATEPETQCLDDYELTVFHSAERSFHMEIPDYMKNLLTIAGIKSSALIATMNENTIEDVEVFAREKLKNMISENDIVKYYGWRYQKHPEKFRSVPGHKKLLHMLIKFYKNQVILSTKENTKNKTELKLNDNVCTARSIVNSSSEEKSNKFFELSANLGTDSTEENKTVLKLVKKWVKSKVDQSRWLTLNFELDNAIFYTHCSIRNEKTCQITCFCKSTYRVPKLNNMWDLSNLFAHLSAKHLNESLNIKPINRLVDMPGTSKIVLQNDVFLAKTSDPKNVNANAHFINEKDEDIVHFRAEQLINNTESQENLQLVENETSQEILHEMSANIDSRTTTKRNVEFSLSPLTKKSKWSTLKYSRSERRRRARERYNPSQTLITNFFDIANNLCHE